MGKEKAPKHERLVARAVSGPCAGGYLHTPRASKSPSIEATHVRGEAALVQKHQLFYGFLLNLLAEQAARLFVAFTSYACFF